VIQDVSFAVGLLLLLLLALEAGFRAGRHTKRKRATEMTSQVGPIQGAILGLLGLLLAFSFAAAGARFLERQDLIVQEANAIGTAYLRADVLDEPYRSELRAALKRYTERRIEVSRRLEAGATLADMAEVEQLHSRIWKAASDGVAARPAAMLAVLTPVNEVIDLHATRVAAARKRLPSLVLVSLIASSMLAVWVIGYGTGLAGPRHVPLTFALTILIGMAFWITIDLDRPRAGLIRLSDAPLEALKLE
jgi:hypothetical protein